MKSNLEKTLTLKSILHTFKQKRGITDFDIAVFLRQMATLITAGIPLIKSCDILEKSQVKTALQLLIYSIKREILTGKDLFFSLRHHHHYFDEMTCQLIKIGEHTGKLDTMLCMIASHKEKKLAFKRQVKQALFYPCMITITTIIVTLCMFIFVIPRFAELFHDSQIHLPLLTTWIFFLSSKLQQHTYFIFAPILFIVLVILSSKLSSSLKKNITLFLIKSPIINTCVQKVILARFARNVAITFAAGMPITEALRLAMNASGHSEFAGLASTLRNKINSGLQLHQAMQTLSYFPDMMIQMVKIGEESGMLEHMLNKLADFFESDIDHWVGQLSQLLEPLIMLVLGVLIGGLVIAMYLPIFKLGSVL